jgi:hypothetical protein
LTPLIFKRQACAKMTERRHPPPGQNRWTAAAFLTTGFAIGLADYALTRHKRSPPPLALALHILFAGLGFLFFAAIVLS